MLFDLLFEVSQAALVDLGATREPADVLCVLLYNRLEIVCIACEKFKAHYDSLDALVDIHCGGVTPA